MSRSGITVVRGRFYELAPRPIPDRLAKCMIFFFEGSLFLNWYYYLIAFSEISIGANTEGLNATKLPRSAYYFVGGTSYLQTDCAHSDKYSKRQHSVELCVQIASSSNSCFFFDSFRVATTQDSPTYYLPQTRRAVILLSRAKFDLRASVAFEFFLE